MRTLTLTIRIRTGPDYTDGDRRQLLDDLRADLDETLANPPSPATLDLQDWTITGEWSA